MKIPSFCLLLAAAVLPLMTVSCASTRGLPEPGTFQRSGAIGLDVATSKPAYQVGETLAFTVRPSEDCHLAAWVIGADGVTTPLYPNAHDAGGRVFRRGVTSTLPGAGSFQFRVAPPAGREQLVVVASSFPVAASPTAPEPGLWLKGVAVQARGPATASAPAAERRGEARVVYEVLP